jgi:hypothetical protein
MNQDSNICKIQHHFNENSNPVAEKWVWEEIKSGIPADFNTRFGKLYSERSGDWYRGEMRRRAISSKFLEIILLDETCQKEIPHTGVHIIGAWFGEDEINLENSELKHQLKLEESRFEGRVNFKHLKSPFGISFKKSFFARQFNMSWADIKGPLEMDNVKFGLKVGARERGVWVQETPVEDKEAEWVFMRGLRVDSDVIMNEGDFFPVDLQLAKIGGRLNLAKTHFRPSDCPKSESRPYCEESFLMAGSQIDGEVDMSQAKFLGKVSLRGAEIGNIVSMEKAIFGKELYLERARIKGSLIMEGGIFHNKVVMTGTEVEGDIFMSGEEKKDKKSTFKGDVELYRIRVRDMLVIKDAIFYGKLSMQAAIVGSNLDFRNSHFDDKVKLNTAKLERNFYLANAKFKDELALIAITVSGTLSFEGTQFHDLQKSSPDPDVRLNSAKIDTIEYKGIQNLNEVDLSGAHVDKLLISLPLEKNNQGEKKTINESNWLRFIPKHLKVFGFTYNQVVVEQGPTDSDWYFDLQAKITDYSPQPYEQAAKVLVESGRPDLANKMLRLRMDKEKQEAKKNDNYLRYSALLIFGWTIGYGIGLGPFRPILVLSIFFIIGTFVCHSTRGFQEMNKLLVSKSLIDDNPGSRDIPNKKKIGFAESAAYSADLMMPLINLWGKHDKIDMPGKRRYYFYFHKMLGWLMFTFIAAGVAGLIQK